MDNVPDTGVTEIRTELAQYRAFLDEFEIEVQNGVGDKDDDALDALYHEADEIEEFLDVLDSECKS